MIHHYQRSRPPIRSEKSATKNYHSSPYQDSMAHTQLRQGVWVTCSRTCPVTAAQFVPNMAKIELLGIKQHMYFQYLGVPLHLGRIHLNILTNKVHPCKLTLDNPPCWEYLPGITRMLVYRRVGIMFLSGNSHLNRSTPPEESDSDMSYIHRFSISIHHYLHHSKGYKPYMI